MRNIKSIIAFFLCTTVICSCTTKENIDWKQYDLITNVDELVAFFPDLNLDRNGKHEKAEILSYFDGSKGLVYEYELLESENYDPLYYSITIETTLTEKEAKESFYIKKTALIAGNKWSDMKVQAFNIELPGDQNYYAMRTLDDSPNGLLYITRRGKNVYSLIISGLYSSDHSIITSLILPELEALENFSL